MIKEMEKEMMKEMVKEIIKEMEKEMVKGIKERVKEMVKEMKEMVHHQSDGGRDRNLCKSTINAVGRFYTKFHFKRASQ